MAWPQEKLMATTTTNDAKELIRTVLDAFSDRDFDTIAAAHADDVVLFENGTEYRGYDAVEEHMAAALHALEDPEFDVEEVLTDEDTLACRYTISAGVEGSRVESAALCLARVKDGELHEIWVNSNTNDFDQSEPVTNADEGANIRIVQSLYKAASDGEFDVEPFLAPLADDIEWIEPDGSPVGGVHRGHDGVMSILETMVTDFESFEIEPHRYIADDDTVAVPVTEHFVLEEGARIDVRALHLYDLREGKIIRMENFEDTALLD
ncbi:nuclear transport factor 2 family protein [Haladaptatus sp. CMSO5]|uniref:nuclear transport factor 2 family protein n=1 Tax=Haladaptatus sp. CMSO5 TaxID=3120514 RepID=UPI002FCE5087